MTSVIPRQTLAAAAVALLAAAALAQDAPAPAPPPSPPAEEAEPPAPAHAARNIEQAFRRMESLRNAPASAPGTLARRRERFRAIAAEALALPEAKTAAGEDLYRLAAICIEGERFAEAADAAGRYLAGGGKEPLPKAGLAHAARVRALARLGKLEEAEAALRAWREALPASEGIASVTKALADAFVAAGKVEESLPRYREAFDRAPRPLRAGAAEMVQGLVEALAATGKPEEARRVLDRARKEEGKEEGFTSRLDSVGRRLDMAGKPFPPPRLETWAGAPAPEEAALRGKVVVWHLFAWWMESRLDELDAWAAKAAEGSAKGLVLFPVTRFSGWDPATRRFVRESKPEAEFPAVEKAVRAHGWKGPFAVAALHGRAFEDLGVRGLPMDVVVGRDGNVIFVQAGEEAGPALARMVAARALDAPPPPAQPAPGDPPPAGGADGGVGK